MKARNRNSELPAAFATSDSDEKMPEPTVVPTPRAMTAPRPSFRPSSLVFSDMITLLLDRPDVRAGSPFALANIGCIVSHLFRYHNGDRTAPL